MSHANQPTADRADDTVIEVIAHVILMGRGLYPTPKDHAAALLKRLALEGYAVVRMPGVLDSE